MDFYRHLLDYECIPQNHLPDEQQPLMATSQVLNYNYYQQLQQPAIQTTGSDARPVVKEITDNGSERMDEVSSEMEETHQKIDVPREEIDADPDVDEPPVKKLKPDTLVKHAGRSKILFLQRSFSVDCQPVASDAGVSKGAQSGLLNEYAAKQGQASFDRPLVQKQKNTPMFNMGQYFPRGALDEDGQQLDLRRTNSWRTVLDHVPVSELMELMVVNVIAPFILNRDLKSLMKKSPGERKFIVNVSAMEGQFNRASKTKFHPHTNMAKAALNMMTRTAALGYKNQGIFMMSVDTGWVTDERPLHIAKKEKRLKGFRLPLDCVDGAARIYDPVVTGLSKEETPDFAVFLKDYKRYPW